jgi:hypothetical protein
MRFPWWPVAASAGRAVERVAIVTGDKGCRGAHDGLPGSRVLCRTGLAESHVDTPTTSLRLREDRVCSLPNTAELLLLSCLSLL